MIVKDIETVLIVSAAIAKVPLVNRLEKDPFQVIDTGDFVQVDAEMGIVTITKQKP
jgi:predicted aconitase with swiveling domain